MELFECGWCHLKLDESKFSTGIKICSGSTKCRKCRSIIRGYQQRQRRISLGLPTRYSSFEIAEFKRQNKKYCPKCKQILDLSCFSTMKVRDGIASHCRPCSNLISRGRNSHPVVKEKRHDKYIRNKYRLINNNLIQKFGITHEDYMSILASQNNVCFICGRNELENKKRLAVDHDHKTNKIRSILCASCNLCIGFIEKNNIDTDSISRYCAKYGIGKNNKPKDS